MLLDTVILVTTYPLQSAAMVTTLSLVLKLVCDRYVSVWGVEDGLVNDYEANEILNDRYPIEVVEAALEMTPLALDITETGTESYETECFMIIGMDRIGGAIDTVVTVVAKIVRRVRRTFLNRFPRNCHQHQPSQGTIHDTTCKSTQPLQEEHFYEHHGSTVWRQAPICQFSHPRFGAVPNVHKAARSRREQLGVPQPVRHHPCSLGLYDSMFLLFLVDKP